MSMVHVLGNATVDLTLVLPAWPSLGETVLAERLVRGAGGKGFNQAYAAACADARVRLSAPVGRDPDGAFLRMSVGDRFAVSWRDCEAATDVSTIWVGAEGENMIASSADCARSIAPDEVAALLVELGPGDVLAVQGNLPADTTLAACRHARASGGRVIVNTAPLGWDMGEVMREAEVVVCNAPEIAAITGLAGEAAALRLSEHGPSVMLTLGSGGALVADGGTVTPIAAPRVTAVDTSGAGDVATGYLAAELARGTPLLEAARCAIRAASISVTRVGTSASCPSWDEVRGRDAVDPA